MKDPTKAVIGVSEHFYSLQGEGPETGYPAVFLRTKGCTLNCTYCDTSEVWKRGTAMKILELLQLFKTSGYVDRLSKGAILVLTGGSPLLQQDSLSMFLTTLSTLMDDKFLHVSVETEGVLLPSDEFAQFVSTWIVSPKLISSGEPESKRIKEEPLRWHARSSNTMTYFKFVVGSYTDLTEMQQLVSRFRIRPSSVWVMPKASSKADLDGQWASVDLPEICKQNHYKYCNRLHIQLWNKTTGV
jgi:7-carboxy-7-deazaguanine synthase